MGVSSLIKLLLQHHLSRHLDVDDPQTTVVRREIIRSKPFLRRLYQEWYELIAASLAGASRPILEIGSGAGFFDEYESGLIRSDVLDVPHVDLVCSALGLPFANQSLGGVVMTNVFHHLPDTARFISEAGRCTKQGGVIVMIEPWVTPWARLVYTRLHEEPFDVQAEQWRVAPGRPLSSANGALPWIVFSRDRRLFDTAFPDWRIEKIRLLMPFVYLLSGGVSLRSMMPGWSYGFWRAAEKACALLNRDFAMFALIVLRKVR